MGGRRRALAFPISGGYSFRTRFKTVGVARMSALASRIGLAFVLALLCLGGRAAHAQTAPVRYWIPGWPIGFGGDLSAGQGANTYGNFPSFDGSDTRSGGFYNFPSGWFVGGERGSMGMSMSGINPYGAFGNIGSLRYEGVQFGYNVQNGGLPFKVYGGFDTLKYDSGIGGPLAPFDSMSGTRTGYSAHAGVAFQPAPNLSLSLGFGYTQQSGRVDTDTPSPALSTESPYALVGHR
jgi:opacity protein-like surface antigen